MSIVLKNTLRALATVLAIGIYRPTQKPLPKHLRPQRLQACCRQAADSPARSVRHRDALARSPGRVCSRPSRTSAVAELRSNTVMLAKLATLMKIPVITTASEPNGTNGPLMPEIHQFAPHAVYVPRKGEVNAWDNEDFVKAVRATGKKTLIMAGVWTSVCVMFPALDAKAAGFKVYAVMDASGDPSEMASRTSLARFVQGGVIPTTTNAVLSEVHRTWNRPEAAEIGGALCSACRRTTPQSSRATEGPGGRQAGQISQVLAWRC